MANNNLAVIDTVVKKVAPRYRHVSPIETLQWSTEKQHVLTVIKSSKQLQQATPDSLHDSVLQSASMGLSLNPALHHCYLIPRRMRKRKQGESDKDYEKVPFIAYASPSYRGLSHLAVSSGAVRFLKADIIFKDDDFSYKGSFEKPHYLGKSVQTGNQKERDAIGVIAVARTLQGDWLCEFINRETVLKIRKMSEMPNGAIWNPDKWWTEGWKKAAIRRLYKTLPDATQPVMTAMNIMNEHEGLAEPINQEKDITPVPVLSDDQALELHALLSDHDMEPDVISRWLKKLATRFKVAEYQDIPAEHFNDALAILKQAVQ